MFVYYNGHLNDLCYSPIEYPLCLSSVTEIGISDSPSTIYVCQV